MTKAADAIALAALRSPRPEPDPRRAEERPLRRPQRRSRRWRLKLGRLMFAFAVLYLIGCGLIGELQLQGVQAQERRELARLGAVKSRNAQLQAELSHLRSSAGERQAVRAVLHYAPAGTMPVRVTVVR